MKEADWVLISLNPFAGDTVEGLNREILDVLFFSLEVTKLFVLSLLLGRTLKGVPLSAPHPAKVGFASTCVLLMILGVCRFGITRAELAVVFSTVALVAIEAARIY